MTNIPIVFAIVRDPVGEGLVAGLARPGGNATGLSLQITDLAGKRVELLREIVPGLRRLAVLAHAPPRRRDHRIKSQPFPTAQRLSALAI